MTGGRPLLRIEGSITPPQDGGTPMSEKPIKPAAPAHDRGPVAAARRHSVGTSCVARTRPAAIPPSPQQLPQPALPKVPGRGGARVDGGTGSGAASPVLPRRIHAAVGDRRYRLSEQGGDLRSPVQASAESMLTIAADPRHLGAKIAIMSVLHTWGSAMTHHPHVHMIVPDGGISLDGSRWIAKRPDFLLPVRVLPFPQPLMSKPRARRLALCVCLPR
jgi:hypothetical protein